MIRKLKTMKTLLEEFPKLRFSKEGTLILDGGVNDYSVGLDYDQLKYIGNEVESDKLDLPECVYEYLPEVERRGKLYAYNDYMTYVGGVSFNISSEQTSGSIERVPSFDLDLGELDDMKRDQIDLEKYVNSHLTSLTQEDQDNRNMIDDLKNQVKALETTIKNFLEIKDLENKSMQNRKEGRTW